MIDDTTTLSGALAMIQAITNNDKDVDLYITSPGGYVVPALKLVDLMKTSKIKIHCHAVGLTASMASYLLESDVCVDRSASPNTIILFHEPHLNLKDMENAGIVYLDRADLEEQFRSLSILADLMSKTESSRLKITRSEFENNIYHKDWLLNPDEALKYGAIDKIDK